MDQQQQLRAAIERARPGASFVLRGPTLAEDLDWQDPSPPPAEAEVAAEMLAVLREDAAARVDRAAEAARLRWITPGSGQAMAYQAKAAEARMLLDAGEPDPDDYPHLVAEIGITAPSLEEVADVVLQMAGTWRQVSVQIEGERLAAKRAIAEATEAAEIQATLAALNWPSP